MFLHSSAVSVPGPPGLRQADVLQGMSEHLDWMTSSEVWDEDELRDADNESMESEKGEEEPEVLHEGEDGVESVWRRGGRSDIVVPAVDL